MAKQWSLNNTPATGAVAMFLFKELLKTAGWTAQSSGDATTYFNASDGITTGASGAGGFGNTRAWWRGRSPMGVRELVIQRGTTNLLWRIKLSPAATFVGGSPNATTVPSATDEVVLCGTGSDASPTGATLFAADGTYRFNAMADGSAPYGYYYFAFPTGGGNPNAAFVMDPLTQTEAGDPDPYAYYLSQNSANTLRGDAGSQDLTTENGTHSPKSYLGAVATAANFVSTIPALPGNAPATLTYVGALPVSPFSSNNQGLPFWYGRRNALTAPRGYKGWSSFMRANITTALTTGTTGNTLQWILAGNIWLPWDGATTPTI